MSPSMFKCGSCVLLIVCVKLMSWARCLYNEVSLKLDVLVDHDERATILYHEHRKLVRECLCDMDMPASRYELIGHYVALYGYSQIVDDSDMEYLAEMLFEMVLGFGPLTVLCLSKCLSHMLGLPEASIDVLNSIVFQGHMEDTLDLSRKQRVDVVMDKMLFMYLCVRRDLLWNRVITDARFGNWVSEGMCDISRYGCVCDALIDNRLIQVESGMCFERFIMFCSRASEHYKNMADRLNWRQRRKRHRGRRGRREVTLGRCGICMEDDMRVLKTKCGHFFCAQCVDRWSKSTCPLCRCKNYV